VTTYTFSLFVSGCA